MVTTPSTTAPAFLPAAYYNDDLSTGATGSTRSITHWTTSRRSVATSPGSMDAQPPLLLLHLHTASRVMVHDFPFLLTSTGTPSICSPRPVVRPKARAQRPTDNYQAITRPLFARQLTRSLLLRGHPHHLGGFANFPSRWRSVTYPTRAGLTPASKRSAQLPARRVPTGPDGASSCRSRARPALRPQENTLRLYPDVGWSPELPRTSAAPQLRTTASEPRRLPAIARYAARVAELAKFPKTPQPVGCFACLPRAPGKPHPWWRPLNYERNLQQRRSQLPAAPPGLAGRRRPPSPHGGPTARNDVGASPTALLDSLGRSAPLVLRSQRRQQGLKALCHPRLTTSSPRLRERAGITLATCSSATHSVSHTGTRRSARAFRQHVLSSITCNFGIGCRTSR